VVDNNQTDKRAVNSIKGRGAVISRPTSSDLVTQAQGETYDLAGSNVPKQEVQALELCWAAGRIIANCISLIKLVWRVCGWCKLQGPAQAAAQGRVFASALAA
jgi:hypothetical protein